MISTKVILHNKIHQSKELAEKKQQNQLWSEKKQTKKVGNWWEEFLDKVNCFKYPDVPKTDSY